MTRLEMKSRVGADGVLTLRIPIGSQDANQEVLITVEAAAQRPLDREEWRRFLCQTAGSISDPTFKRHEQGEFEQREAL